MSCSKENVEKGNMNSNGCDKEIISTDKASGEIINLEESSSSFSDIDIPNTAQVRDSGNKAIPIKRTVSQRDIDEQEFTSSELFEYATNNLDDEICNITNIDKQAYPAYPASPDLFAMPEQARGYTPSPDLFQTYLPEIQVQPQKLVDSEIPSSSYTIPSLDYSEESIVLTDVPNNKARAESPDLVGSPLDAGDAVFGLAGVDSSTPQNNASDHGYISS